VHDDACLIGNAYYLVLHACSFHPHRLSQSVADNETADGLQVNKGIGRAACVSVQESH